VDINLSGKYYSPMAVLLLPFAIRKSDGEFVTAEDVERGLKCDCICPGCASAVMAKQGTEKIWHFAHHQAAACADGYEKSVHELAKQLIRQRKSLLLPSLDVVARGRDAFGIDLIERELIFDASLCDFEKCTSNADIGPVTVDVHGQLRDRQLIIEVTVFHRISPDKQERIEQTGIGAMEIDLSRFKTEQATLPKLEDAIFCDSSIRKWIFHPRLAGAKLIVNQRLQVRLNESQMKFEAEEEERKSQRLAVEASRMAESAISGFISAAPVDGNELSVKQPRWRSCLPGTPDLKIARQGLSERTSKPIDDIVRVTSQISRRGQLQSITPYELAAQWATALDVTQSELMRYVFEGKYVL
jgi:hypothetical protein